MHQQTKAKRQNRLALEALKVPEVAARLVQLQRQKGLTINRKGTPEIQKFVLDMHLRGFMRTELAEFMSVSVPTIATWVKIEKNRRLMREAVGELAPAPAPIQLPEPTLVEAGTITMIRAPRRSLWDRVRDFFS